MTLGERLYQYRKGVNLSQDALAEKVGVTRQTISKWETDQSTPEFSKLGILCEIFNITPNELVYGEEKEEGENTKGIEDDEKKRNKKKALVVSISIFLYCMGIFSIPYMIESLQYDDSQSVLMASSLWAIATAILVYFFLANPKKKKEKREEKEIIMKEEKPEKLSKVELGIFELVASIFLCIYLIISFATSAWHITWILWIVLIVVELIVKLILDMRREEKNGKR